MATELLNLTTARSKRETGQEGEESRVNLTKFYGGENDGACLQVTIGFGYVQLTQEEADEVMSAICDFLRSVK